MATKAERFKAEAMRAAHANHPRRPPKEGERVATRATRETHVKTDAPLRLTVMVRAASPEARWALKSR